MIPFSLPAFMATKLFRYVAALGLVLVLVLVIAIGSYFFGRSDGKTIERAFWQTKWADAVAAQQEANKKVEAEYDRRVAANNAALEAANVAGAAALEEERRINETTSEYERFRDSQIANTGACDITQEDLNRMN